MSTTLKAVVMLTVVAALPAAWIHYGRMPTRAQQFVDRGVNFAREAFGLAPLAREARDGATHDAALLLGDGSATNAATTAGSLIGPKSADVSLESSSSAPIPPATASASQEPPIAAIVEPLLAELRSHGAVEYELEHWGSSGKLYRFHCSMPLAGSADHTQMFEAVAADPAASVQQVVADVAAWRSRRAERTAMR